MNRFEWTEASTVEEATAQLREATAARSVALKAGGIDLLDRMKEGIDAPARLVNIRTIKGLDRVEVDHAGRWHIGPLTTLARLAEDPDVRRGYPALAAAAGHAATPQIRNVATLGGNLLQRPRCWYFRSEEFRCLKKGGDRCFAIPGENQYHAVFGNGTCAIVHPSSTATVLVALGAEVALQDGKGSSRTLPLEELFTPPEKDVRRENSLRPDEMLTEVRLPVVGGARSVYLKQGEKESFDWPIAEVAVSIGREGDRCRTASVVLGAAAPVPLRARGAEAALVGKRIDEATAREAAKAAVEGATPLSKNGYKLSIFEALVRRAILAAWEP